MDDGGDGIFATVTRWSTPTILFCMLNLMVVTIFIRSKLKPKKNIQEQQLISPLISEENDAVHFFKFPSLLLTRVKSINFTRRKDPEEEQKEEEVVEEEEVGDDDDEEEKVEEERHVERTMSDTIAETTVVKRQVMRGVKMMQKSQSARIGKVEEVEEVERQRPATVRERKGNMNNGLVHFGEDEAVDDKADDFINKFRQQLKLQRLESFLKYRGASK